MLYFFNKILALMITAVMFIGVGSNGAPAHTVLDEENCLLNATILSDVHIEGNNVPRYNVFGQILKDVKNTKTGNDALVFLGDNTMNGQNIESLLFYGQLGKMHAADKTIVALGNHDIGNGEGDLNRLFSRFAGYNKAFFNRELNGKPYFYEIVNGYYFIVLGPEELTVHDFPFSEEQLQFLDETLAAATADGKPAFIFCHYSSYYIDDYAMTDKVDQVIDKYNNVFYFYGHSHMPLNYWSFHMGDTYPLINLPRCTDLTGEKDNEPYEGTGIGMQLEVYPDEVVVRARNFYTGNWEPDYEYHYDIVK